MALPRKNFLGMIDGETVMSLQKKLDFGIRDLEGRINKVSEIIECSDFLVEYLSEYYTGITNTKEVLSEETNVFKMLDSFITYIMNSDEVKQQEKDKEIKYKFYRNPEWFEAVLRKEANYNNVQHSDAKSADIFLHILLTNANKNYKKSLDIEVLEKDIQDDSEMGEILRQYQSMLNHIDIKLKLGDCKGMRYKYTRAKKSLSVDMLDVKKCFKGFFRAKGNPEETCDYNILGRIDLTNGDHVKHALKIPFLELRPENDLDILAYDLQQYINKTKLSVTNLRILELYRKGMTSYQIGQIVELDHSTVLRNITSMSKKIANTVKKLGGY